VLASDVDPSRLGETWPALVSVLPKCNPQVQRAVAEVWGAVLRRLKGDARVNAVEMLSKDLEGIEDAAAWIVVSACKVTFPQ
jgi:U3 small nucleolar RNA-associated protein 20